jgi:hypothetical protein
VRACGAGRKGAAPLTRPARRGRCRGEGRPDMPTRARRAASNKGVEQGRRGEGAANCRPGGCVSRAAHRRFAPIQVGSPHHLWRNCPVRDKRGHRAFEAPPKSGRIGGAGSSVNWAITSAFWLRRDFSCAVGVGDRPWRARTKRSSVHVSFKRARAWLAADWLSARRSAAPLTARSS